MAIRIGNNGANTLNGTNSSDVIFGLGGDDIINAGAGNDWLFAGAGNDQIFAGDGSDWVFADIGNDVVSGGNGNDFLYGEAGNDVLDGGRGSDIVDGGAGADTLIFTDAERGGLDRYIGGSGQDSLVLEFGAGRWADPAVKAQVLAFLDFLAAGGTGNFNFTTMNLIVTSVEALVVKVDGVIIDPRAGGNTVPTGVADSFDTGENGILDVSPATERGTLVDNDNTGNGAFTVELVTGPANGSLTLNPDGTFSFNPGAAFDYLNAGQSAVETFTYRIVNSAGASDPITVTLNIEGANDAAVLGGVTAGAVSEDDEVTTASGTVTISDADAGQSALANPGTFQGVYGSLALAADGTWTYTIDNSLGATQALGADDSATESFAIGSLDGTAASAIAITVNGTNDIAAIAGDLEGSVTEDIISLETEAPLVTASGQVTVEDADSGESAIGNPGTYAGEYGSLVLQADGSWVYTLDNSLPGVQTLGAGVSAIDSFQVTSLDGSAASAIAITVNGTNDIAAIAGDLEGAVTEDIFSLETEAPLVTASGQVTVEDADSGESAIGNPGTYAGEFGSLVLQADGSWVYTLDNSLPGVQALGAGVSAIDSFQVTSLDGSVSTEIAITVNGTNDEPSIEGNNFGQVNEDGSSQANEGGTLTASGQLVVIDADAGELAFAESGILTGLYGSLDLAEDGTWTYTLNNSLSEVQSLRAGEQVYETFNLTTVDGTGSEINITVEGVNDEAEISGELSATIYVQDEGIFVQGFVNVTDIDHDESGVEVNVVEGDYGYLFLEENGEWFYLLDESILPVEGSFILSDVFTMQTLGGDSFNIDVTIQQDGFILG